MPINRRLDLPASPPPDGHAPDLDPWVGRAIAEAWLDEHYSAEKAHAVEGTRFRFSMAGNCTRAMAYYFAGVPESNPPDAASAWRMGLGTMVHDAVQAQFLKAFPGAEIEVTVHDPGLDGSGHIDLVIRNEGSVTAIELKTVNGFGFKMMATNYKGPPDGPRRDHIIQAALAGRAVDADEIVVAYLSMENVSPDLAKYSSDPVFGKFTAQWTFSRAEYIPIAQAEERRVQHTYKMLADVDGKPGLVTPYLTDDEGTVGTILPPASRNLVGLDGTPMGKVWQCDYCRWKETCTNDG